MLNHRPHSKHLEEDAHFTDTPTGKVEVHISVRGRKIATETKAEIQSQCSNPALSVAAGNPWASYFTTLDLSDISVKRANNLSTNPKSR